MPLLLSLVATAVGLSLCLMVVPYQVDDAFITYRYAAHMVAGHGFVYNAGGPETEGFSSPLWLGILVGGGALIGVNYLPLVSIGAGLLSYLAAIGVMGRSERGAETIPWCRLGFSLFALLRFSQQPHRIPLLASKHSVLR